ncbi:hypothetical protein AGMMS49545_19510 [Betaproteobacteria bacterium]|nr:hypothetical protein AGMMS49545_19510 [Betaproteobacteria bacterium]
MVQEHEPHAFWRDLRGTNAKIIIFTPVAGAVIAGVFVSVLWDERRIATSTIDAKFSGRVR